MAGTRPEPLSLWASRQRRELDALTKRDQVTLIEGERNAVRELLELLGDAFGAEPSSPSKIALWSSGVRIPSAPPGKKAVPHDK